MVKIDMSKLEENNYHLQTQVQALKSALQDTSVKMKAVPNSEGFSGKTQQQMSEYVEAAHGRESQQLTSELDQLAQGMERLINDFKADVDSSSQAKIDTDNLDDLEKILIKTKELNGRTMARLNKAYQLALEAGADCQLIDDQADEALGKTIQLVQQTKRKVLNYNNRTLPLALKDLSHNLVHVKSDLAVTAGIKGQGKDHFQMAAFLTELGHDGWNTAALTSYEHFLNDSIKNLKGNKLSKQLNHLFKQARQVGSSAFNALFRPYAQTGVSQKAASSALTIMLKYLGATVEKGYLKLKHGFPMLNPFDNELLQTLLPKVVQTAFPFTKGKKGGLSTASGTLATEIHQLRYYISDSNAKYVEQVAKKLHVTPGEYLDDLSQTGQFKVGSESARAHNKSKTKDFYPSIGSSHNYKLLSNFHVEFIINNQTGQLLHVDSATTIGKSGRNLTEWQTDDLAGFVNGPSYNYANQNDMNLSNENSSHFNYDYSYGNMDMPNRNDMLVKDKTKDKKVLYKTPQKEGKNKYQPVDSYSDYHRQKQGK